MLHHRIDEERGLQTTFHWLLLAFNAGCINAGGYLACHRFVSHVTGFATLFGIDMASGRLDAALGIVSVPVFFLGGSMVSAWLIDRQEQLGKKPHYAWVMALVAACLTLAAFLGERQFFGSFGGEPKLKADYFLLALLCMASGLQNAAITTASGATVRTTHLTGITTDLGIGLVRQYSRDFARTRNLEKEARANRLRVGTIAAFALGSVLSAVIYLKAGYLGFLIPAALAATCMLEAAKRPHQGD